MNASLTPWSRIVPAAMGLMSAGVLAYLWGANLPLDEVPMRLPASPAESAGSGDEKSALELAELAVSAELKEVIPGEWPGFRGQGHDGVSHETVALRKDWSAPPSELWSLELGEGYAGAAVAAGRVYVMDYDRDLQRDALRCLSLADGTELWRFSYPLIVKRNHGMSRTVAAVGNGRVVAMGPKCHVSCLDAVTGEFKWGIDLVKEYGTEVPPWYAGQCPLIRNGQVILAPAGNVMMMAVDLESGEVVWETPNPQEWKMTHVSVVPAMLCNRACYIYCGSRGVVGVAADSGEILWESKAWKISIATVSSPIPVGDNRLFFSGGYRAGSLMMRVSEKGGTWVAEEEFRLDADEFGATQQTPVIHEGFIYGVRPNGELCCLDESGEVRWASGMDHRFGLGPLVVADGRILVMNDDGLLSMVEATPESFQLLGQATILDGHDSWGPMAIAGGRLIARDLTRMVCVDLKEVMP